MENQGFALLSYDNLRNILAAQDDNLQQLHKMIADFKDEKWNEIQNALLERLAQLEETEQRIRKALFSQPHNANDSVQRMTIDYCDYSEYYY